VRPQCFGRGIGSSLEQACVAALRAAGAERAILWVLRDNVRARGFYERRGWTADGAERDHSFGEDGSAPTVRYRRSLRRGREGESPP
jgi:ribosomal protein S18 acetylase RimI-like enzyme